MRERGRVGSVEEVPESGTFLFTVRDVTADERREAILVRAAGRIVGWLNHCQHLTNVALDKGSGAPMRDGEIVCQNHGAYFEADTGFCTFGPCEGAYLDGIDVAVADGTIYLTDDDYEFVHVGPIERDGVDLSSTSNLEF